MTLRFNPDGNTAAKGLFQVRSCFKYRKTLGVPVIHDKAMWKACMNAYIECVRYHLNHLPETEVTVEHMLTYYDITIYRIIYDEWCKFALQLVSRIPHATQGPSCHLSTNTYMNAGSKR